MCVGFEAPELLLRGVLDGGFFAFLGRAFSFRAGGALEDSLHFTFEVGY